MKSTSYKVPSPHKFVLPKTSIRRMQREKTEFIKFYNILAKHRKVRVKFEHSYTLGLLFANRTKTAFDEVSMIWTNVCFANITL